MNRAKNMRRKTSILLIVFLVMIVFLGVFAVDAMYVSRWKGAKGAVKSEKFYFSSNILTEDGACYEVRGNCYRIYLNNFLDKERVNKEDISFTASVENGYFEADGLEIGDDKKTAAGVIKAGRKNSVILIVKPEKNKKSVKINVQSKSPYQKKLSATINFRHYKGLDMTISDNEAGTSDEVKVLTDETE